MILESDNEHDKESQPTKEDQDIINIQVNNKQKGLKLKKKIGNFKIKKIKTKKKSATNLDVNSNTSNPLKKS